MKHIFSHRLLGSSLLVSSLSILLAFTSETALRAEDKRTDGKPGSEYGDFSSWDGEWRIGAQFGALLPTASSADASFAVGADLDYRPYEVFGFRTTYLQGLKSPRASVISITPLVHTTYSNLMPYAFAGPGIAIVNAGGTEAKFLVALGAGADISIVDRFAVGMLWSYDAIIDGSDFHALTARFSYRF